MAKTLVGTVSSVAPNKTIVITTHTRKTHPIYKKQYTVTSKYMAHDENNDCKVGDKVSIVETRPLSARKRFALQEIIQRATLTKEDKDAIEASAVTTEQTEEAK
jgi:small subunit ribosomal protein S17